MIFFFREANEETCTRENKYKDEYDKAFEEFTKKYGRWGEKLKTKAQKKAEKKKGWYSMYSTSDVPEYKEIDRLYFEEQRAIREYRNECKDKALELFKKWFWQLWD